MNRIAWVARNLRYHARGNLAVLLGAAVGAAVLTGALLVGDSLRGSLHARTERQLQGIDNVLVSTRFLRQDLTGELPGQVRGALLLQGSVYVGSPTSDRRAGKVTVWGVNRAFGIDDPAFDTDQAVCYLSTGLAERLKASVGDTVNLGVQRASTMPRSSFLSRRGVSDTTRTFPLTVKGILPHDHPANSLNLSISPSLPLNIFVPLARLQREVDQSGRINALLAAGQPAEALQSALKERLNLDDWGLKVQIPPSKKGYFSVESTRMLLEPGVVRAVEQTAQEQKLRTARTYTYLANTIAHNGQEIPYSIVAALEPDKKTPLGPFLPEGVKELKPGEIVLADWEQSPIRIGKDEADPKITITYFKPEIESRIEEDKYTFHYRGKIPLEGVADDRYLTPDFPGITNKGKLESWDPPFPWEKEQRNRIQKPDEEFWNKYRTTPKAYIRLEDGQKLWGTRFGDVTSVRIAPAEGEGLEAARTAFAETLRKNLDPAVGDLIFQPIRARMLEAGEGSTDFGMLFLSFSFFLIVAALLLVGLLFRLNLDRRASEIGLLRATGFPLKSVRRLLLTEGLVLSIIGSAIGLAGAVAYAAGLIRLMVSLWPTPGVASYLRLHVTPTSLLIGFFASVLMSGLAILWALRSLSKVAPAQLLKGNTAPAPDPKNYRPSPWPKRIFVVSLLCAITLAVSAPFMLPGEPQAGTFFGAGALLLTAGMTLLWGWMKRPRHAPVHGQGAAALARLGSRNAVRNPVRSLLTAGLLASAAFLLVAVESFRREPEKNFLDKNGGSGGFPLLAESATPIDFDPNAGPKKDDEAPEIEEGLRLAYQTENLPAAKRNEQIEKDLAALDGVKVYRFRVQAGDDASCLNLYQATRPRLIGVPQEIIDRGGFSFGATLDDPDNPWKQLKPPDDPSQPIPCIVEQNTAMWMLKRGLGDTFETRDEENRPLTLKIVALLRDSVFQSQVLIPDATFRKYFPKTEGFAFFLLDLPPDRQEEVSRVLATALSGYGFETTPTRERVAEYLAVQNTYLTTFQLLGGFGMLLGVLGLAVVLLRSIWERRAELALLRAVGYRGRSLQGIVMAENALLLLVGLGAGVLAALAAVAPHLASGGQVPWGRLGLMLGLVFVVGLSVAFIAVVTTLRAPLIPALREE